MDIRIMKDWIARQATGNRPSFRDLPTCPSCGACSMQRTSLYRFHPKVRIVGWLSLLPSAVGVLNLLLGFGFDRWLFGDGDSLYPVLLASVFLAMPGAVMVMRRRVYRCPACDHVIDRA